MSWLLQVCELDIIFNFHKVCMLRRGVAGGRAAGGGVRGVGLTRSWCGAGVQAYYILDELLLAGHLQEANKREVLHVTAVQDELMDESKEGQGKRR